MRALLLFCMLLGCAEVENTIDDVTSSGQVFVCFDARGDHGILCWDGSARELSESTTWDCRNASEFIDRVVGCDYTCPTPEHGWWSWCPYEAP